MTKKKTSMVLGLVCSVLFFAGAIPFAILGIVNEDYFFFISMGLCVLFGVLFTVLSVKSLKSKGACTALIVFGAIFCLYIFGILLLLAGIKGREQLKAEELERAKNTDMTMDINGAEEDAPVIPESACVAVTETVQPQISAKAKKGIMISLIVSYVLLLLAGVLLAAVPQISKALGDDLETRATVMSVGLMWIALVPSLGFYFATVSPFDISKRKKIVIFVLSAILLVATTAVFFVITNTVELEGNPINSYYDNEDTWFIPLSMVFGALGTICCYALTALKINPAKVPRLKRLITVKEKYPDAFILISTVLLTWLVAFVAFVFAIICIGLFVLLAIVYFLSVLRLGYGSGSSGDDMQAYTFTNDMGCSQTVYSSDGVNFYDSNGALVGKSDDGGNNIYK